MATRGPAPRAGPALLRSTLRFGSVWSAAESGGRGCALFSAPAIKPPVSSPLSSVIRPFNQSPSLARRLDELGRDRIEPICAFYLGREKADFRGPDATCAARPVLNLQHMDSFDRENSWKHKNAANDYGFCLLVFLKMLLVRMRRTSRDRNGDLKSQMTSLAPNEGRVLTKGA